MDEKFEITIFVTKDDLGEYSAARIKLPDEFRNNEEEIAVLFTKIANEIFNDQAARLEFN